MPVPMIQCRFGQLSELPKLFKIACGELSDERARLVLTILQDLVQTGQAEQLMLVVAEQGSGGPVQASAIFLRGRSGTANLLAASGTWADEIAADGTACRAGCRCLQFAHEELRRQEFTFVQAMRPVGIVSRLMSESGYQMLATLDYLYASSDRSPDDCGTADSYQFPARLTFDPFLGCSSVSSASVPTFSEAMFLDLVERTYEGSLDCPRIAKFRSTAEALESYRQVPTHDPNLWFVVGDTEEAAIPIGCLLLTPYWGSGSMELTYMALLATHRRKGLAGGLIEFAKAKTRELNLAQITLAVDAENDPAKRLYARSGFKQLLSETAWGLSL